MTPTLPLGDPVKLNENVHLTETDYGAVLLDEETGNYWELNPPGALILSLLLDDSAEADVAEKLTARYEVARAQAERDVAELVQGLRSQRILTD